MRVLRGKVGNWLEKVFIRILKTIEIFEGIGSGLVGLHQTGLVTISLHLLNRLVWCGGSIGVLPDWSGEKVKVISNQTSLVWGKYFGLTRLNRLKV